MNIALWIIQLVLAITFLVSGLNSWRGRASRWPARRPTPADSPSQGVTECALSLSTNSANHATLATDGTLKATHIETFPLEKAGDGFQLMVQDIHRGKVVVKITG